jgi:16S rRNA processing protein RimM
MTPRESPARDPNFVVMGRINGVFGTRGWLKIHSYTRPRENVLGYRTWSLSRDGDWHTFTLAGRRRQGGALIVSLESIRDRDDAAAWIGCDIAVARDDLPAEEPGEYYWTDLVGLEVVNLEGTVLGRIERLLETGANDVLGVDGDRQRLIPYVTGVYVISADLEVGRMRVDWHEDD